MTALAVAALCALGTGCQGDGPDAPGEDAEDSEDAEEREDREGAGRPFVSPFTGERGERAPVLAVKIDNAPDARPAAGLDRAGIVYVEQVEAGLSRLVAIYSGDLPERVGPVRSARESDLELLRQFGEPALAYSGVQRKLIPVMDEAPLFAVSPDTAPGAYAREESRAAPHNLYADPRAVLAAAPEASEAADIGFRFGQAPPGGEPARERHVSYPNAEFSFDWSDERDRWLVSMDGVGTEVGAATVVLQEVTVRQSEYHDVNGAFTPYTETVGSGEAVVLRDGQAFDAEWQRRSARSGTEFTTPDGEPMRFAPGPVWVVFVPD